MIVEIIYTMYQGLSKRQLCNKYIGRKVNNTPGVYLCQNVFFAHTLAFSPREITWLKPVIQWKKNSTWSAANNFKKAHDLDEL